MKIVTWNINGFRAVTGQNPSKRLDIITKENKLFNYIEKEKPDIICLQETKCLPEQIEEDKRMPPGYEAFYHSCSSKKGYSGVVTFSKVRPKSVNYKVGIDEIDCEGRIAETDFDDFILLNIYFPKAYSDMTRMDFKLSFYDFITERMNNYRKSGKKVIVSGDYNTAHKELDLANPKQNVNTSGFMDIERVKLDKLIENKFIDTFRVFCNEGGHYSWWSQRLGARERNIGWRIDYHFISDNFAANLKNSYIQPEVLGSDHCPVVVEFDL